MSETEMGEDLLTLDFDTSIDAIGDVADFDVLPEGRYRAIATKLEQGKIDNANATGGFISIAWKVCEGDCKGRLIFDRFNTFYRTKSSEPEKIEKAAKTQLLARQQVSNRMRCAGLEGERDTTKIIGREVELSVRISKEKTAPDGTVYKARNEVNKAFPIGASNETSTATAPAPPANGTAKKPPPFLRK